MIFFDRFWSLVPETEDRSNIEEIGQILGLVVFTKELADFAARVSGSNIPLKF